MSEQAAPNHTTRPGSRLLRSQPGRVTFAWSKHVAMGDPYSRVYWSVMDDPKFDGIREDVRLFGSWSLMLVVADMAWPAPAFVPPGIPKSALARLSECGLIDPLPGHRYRVHGLASERERRSTSASQNAQLRWSRPAVEGGRPASRRTRFKVLERDNYRCRYCGRTSDEVAIDVDHVVPVREGGTDDLENLVAACVDCNTGKSGHPLRAHIAEDARASHTDAREMLDEAETRQRRDEIPPPPTSGGRRKDGTNPRATGSAPRQVNASPRQNGHSPRQEREAQKRGGMPLSAREILRQVTGGGA